MPTPTGGKPSCATAPGRTPAAALARYLSALLPGASTVHVRVLSPRTTLWPHLRTTAADAAGRVVPMSRARSLAVARSLIRAFPDARWSESGQIFDLRTGALGAGGGAAC